MDMNHTIDSMKQKVNMDSKPMAIALGMMLGAAAATVTTLALCSRKQMRTLRLIKRAENILYRVGTAMRDVSGRG